MRQFWTLILVRGLSRRSDKRETFWGVRGAYPSQLIDGVRRAIYIVRVWIGRGGVRLCPCWGEAALSAVGRSAGPRSRSRRLPSLGVAGARRRRLALRRGPSASASSGPCCCSRRAMCVPRRRSPLAWLDGGLGRTLAYILSYTCAAPTYYLRKTWGYPLRACPRKLWP
jgi:hypothetical protein